MISRLCLALGLAFACALPVTAQTQAPPTPAPPTRVRGAIETLDGNVLKVTSRTGESLTIRLAEGFGVAAVEKLPIEAIQPNSFVGAAALKGADGRLIALEVLVFPESSRGSSEGHFPWDLQPESTMTNATVATVSGVAEGRELTLTYKGEQQKVFVPPNVPIVTFVAADRSFLQPGKRIFIGAMRQADGSLTASRVVVEKDGVAPPM
jgi:hypothetical protein